MERYQKMWRFMESHTVDTMVHSYEEGVTRVLNGSYAFLGESAMLDYLVQRNCNLTQIGGLLDSKGKNFYITLRLKTIYTAASSLCSKMTFFGPTVAIFFHLSNEFIQYFI